MAQRHLSFAKKQPNPDQPIVGKEVKPVATADPKRDTVAANGESAYVLRDEAEYELIKVNINRLLKGNFEQNIIIEPNDIVQIPKSDIFFVAGEVKAPGNFSLREGTTLRQAIALAQGTKFEGATDRGIIFREDQSGKRLEIPVNISAIMSGKKEDVDILPNDIIMVPNSKTKTIASGALKTISGGLLQTLIRF